MRDRELKRSGMQELIVPQSLEVTLEYIANPMKKTVMTSSRKRMNLRKRKNNGIPGPRKDSWLGSMLQGVSTIYYPTRLPQHSHSSSFYSRFPLKMRFASRCFCASESRKEGTGEVRWVNIIKRMIIH